jgi:hypothetical protein
MHRIPGAPHLGAVARTCACDDGTTAEALLNFQETARATDTVILQRLVAGHFSNKDQLRLALHLDPQRRVTKLSDAAVGHVGATPPGFLSHHPV